ncbi:MAG: ROK family protein [Puniceicoccaceae bacterium]|nr:MAG: ROK family protein [Puniceicoccaceae bacterium]
MVTPQQVQVLQLLRARGPLSRWELHQLTGIRPNTVGDLVNDLLARRIIRETVAATLAPGRPKIPLELESERCHIVGVAIHPREVEATRVNLFGEPLAYHALQGADGGRDLLEMAASLVREAVVPETLAVAVSVAGFLDLAEGRLLLSAAFPGKQPLSLHPLRDAAGGCPLYADNDMHALSARWILENGVPVSEDVMLVSFEDGSFGASILIDGRPNDGCILGGNELGHNRFPVETERCFCGHQGCLERICSTVFYHQRGGHPEWTLEEAVVRGGLAEAAVAEILDYLALGLSNAINLVRPARFVIWSRMLGSKVFQEALIERVRQLLLPDMAERVKISARGDEAVRSAQTAAWLALQELYLGETRAALDPGPSAAASAPAGGSV